MARAPCQIAVWDILPAIRAALAAELVANGVSRLEAARLLDMAPSAVSQYLSKKRGYRIEFDEDILASIRQLALDLQAGSVQDITPGVCAICRQLRGAGDVACKSEKESGKG